MNRYFCSNGQQYELGEEIKSEGQGRICRVKGDPNLLAKIYLRRPSNTQIQKLSCLIHARPEDLQDCTAWPLATLAESQGAPPCGYIMKYFPGSPPIRYMSMPLRMQFLPHVTYLNLVVVSRNIAAVIAMIHKNGYVVGDLNEKNFIIVDDGKVVALDCDSFQVTLGNATLTCDVGVPEYTAPELCGKGAYADLIRTPNHDCFALAMIIFKLLMLSRNPYMGLNPNGNGDPEKLAVKYDYAYGKGAQATGNLPPENAPLIGYLPAEIRDAFELAFARPNLERPSALLWIQYLDTLAKQLKLCDLCADHHYPAHNSRCCWCDYAQRTSIAAFTGALRQDLPLDGEALWASICAIPVPSDVTVTLPDQRRAVARALPASVQSKQLARKTVGFGSLLAGFVFPPAFLGAATFFYDPLKEERELRGRAEREAEAHYRTLHQRWLNECTQRPFLSKKQELENHFNEVKRLPSIETHRINQLQSQARESQQRAYLRNFAIADASIPGVGAVRKDTLISFGIDSAADATYQRVIRVRGFGPDLTRRVTQWRDRLAAQFKFDPSRGADPRELNAIRSDIAAKRQQLLVKLQLGISELKNIVATISNTRRELQPQLDEAAQRLAQAKADMTVL